MQEYHIDPIVLAEFIDDSLEGLAPLDALFIELERHPENLELVNTIFRPVHSVKGSAAFFDLLKIKNLAHKMEDLLDKIRQKRMKASPAAIRVLLPGLDMLRNMFENARAGAEETDDEDKFNEIMESVIKVSEKGDEEADSEIARNTVTLTKNLLDKLEEMQPHLADECSRIIDDAKGILAKITSSVAALAGVQDDGEVVADGSESRLQPILDILKAPIDAVAIPETSAIVKEELIKLQQAADSPETESIVEEALQEYDAFMQHIGFDAILQEALLDKMALLRKTGIWKKETAVSAEIEEKETAGTLALERSGIKPPASGNSGKGRSEAHGESAEKTMRVSDKKIDSFLAYVSEFVVLEEMFNYLQKKLTVSKENRLAVELKRIIETFSILSNDLRNSILSIRMIPARTMLHKALRIAHDVSAASNKKIDVQIQGDDMQIDKSYMEMLDAPLTHMVRNAVDHGIESEEERVSAGKPATGSVCVTLQEAQNDIELIISDDGSGLDHEAITQKAVDIGIIEKGQALNEDAAVDLLFMSGVSTAKEITDVSGRGVGMDVVKRNVEAAGGKIRIKSREMRGTTFVISLPKSVSIQIMDGFLVRAGNDIYVLPMELIGESFALKPENIIRVQGKNEMLLRREKLLPIVRLGRDLNGNFGKPGNPPKTQNNGGNESIAISVAVNNGYHALCVDEIVGVQKVVVREIAGLMIEEELFDGAAMLGDGSVAMILGKPGLAQLATGTQTIS